MIETLVAEEVLETLLTESAECLPSIEDIKTMSLDTLEAMAEFEDLSIGGDIPDIEEIKNTSLESLEAQDEVQDVVQFDTLRVKDYKLPECQEVAMTHFTPEVIGGWKDMGIEQRSQVFEAYQHDIAKELGVLDKGINWYTADSPSHPGFAFWGYNGRDGTINLNTTLREIPENIYEGINTIAHESRHQFQSDAMEGRIGGVVDNQTLALWSEADKLYSSSLDCARYDPRGYDYNHLETDADSFGQLVEQAVTRGIGSIFGGLYNA